MALGKIKALIIILFGFDFGIAFGQDSILEVQVNYLEADKFLKRNEQLLIEPDYTFAKGFKTTTEISEYIQEVMPTLIIDKDSFLYHLISCRISILNYIETSPSKFDKREMSDSNYTILINSENHKYLRPTYNGFENVSDLVKALKESEKLLNKANSSLNNLHKYRYEQIIKAYPFMIDNYPSTLKWESDLALLDSKMKSEKESLDKDKILHENIEKKISQNKTLK